MTMTSSRLRLLLCCGALALGLTTASSAAAGKAKVPGSRRVPPPHSHLTADLGAALGRLHRAVEGETGRPGLKAAGSREDRGELLAAWDGARAADLAFRDRFAAARARLVAAGAGPAVLARLDAAERAYGQASDAILKPLAEPLAEARRAAREKRRVAAGAESQLARVLPGVAAALDEAARRQAPVRILGANALPYRPLQLAARAPVSAPAIQPSYLNPLETAATPADLTGTAEAPLDAEIVAKARELAFDPVKLFELVHNGIATEWYAGSMKGAVETLHQGGGNDVDQASLLIALLRASSLPARYVQGVIELPVETLATSLGVPAAQVPTALARAGIANRPVVSGGRVAFVDLEHTWVAVQVPYTNYRGAVVDFSGRTWLPLAPAIKAITETAPTGVLRRMGLDVGAAVTGYLGAPQPEEPLEAIRRQVLTYLHLQSADAAYTQELGSRAVRAETLGILPGSLAVKVMAVTAEQPALAPALQHRIRFVVRSGPAETDPAVLDATLPLSGVAGRRVTLSYLPATVDDQRAVNAFGGLDSVPVYLVRVRAQIKVDGQVRAQGTGSVPLGATGRFEMNLSGPFGSETVGETVVIGAYQAVAVGAQRAARKPGQGEVANDTEQLAAAILSQEALGYTERWDAAERELGGLLAVSVVRPLPSLAVVTDEVVVESVLGLPVDLTWQGATLDAALRTAEPFARTGDAAAPKDFLRLSALEGSALEHKIFEVDFLVDSLSADKGLGIARKAGAEVVTVTAQNADTVVPTLAHPQAVRDDIANWARLGMSIDVPRNPVALNAWHGAVWRVEDPRTGSAGYFLAGGLAGGATTEPVDGWVLDFLHDALAGPYSDEPDADGLAGASLVKVPGSDEQTGEAGKPLPQQLAVVVRDGQGRPVKGASVFFTSTEGGGKLVDKEGREQSQVTVLTDEFGQAEVTLKLGTHTVDNPVYTLRNPGDEFATRGLVHLIEAEVATHGGSLSIDSPFTAIAFPGPPAKLRRTDTDRTDFTGLGHAGIFTDLIHAAVEDSYGNPIANQFVTFAVGAMVNGPGCPNPPPSPRNAAVFNGRDRAGCPQIPILGTCGGPSFSAPTDDAGVFGGVILGNSVVSGYRVNVNSSGLTPLSFFYSTLFTQINDLDCTELEDYKISTLSLVDGDGRNFQAARAGQRYEEPVVSQLFYWDSEAVVRTRPDGKFYWQYFPQGKWVSSSGELTYTVTNGGSATPAAFTPTAAATETTPAPGYYQTYVTTGPSPAVNEVKGEVKDIKVIARVLDPDTGQVTLHEQPRPGFGLTFSSHLTDVWGLNLEITGVNPTPLVLTDGGQLAAPTEITYRVDPPEYRSLITEMDLSADGEALGTAVGTSRSGLGSASIQRGFHFQTEKHHQAQLILNRGTAAEVKSDLTDLALFQGIFRSYKSQVSLTQDVDLANQRSCSKPDVFQFSLNQAADVTLTARQVSGLNTDGSQVLDAPITLIDHLRLAEGDHSYTVSLGGVPADFVLIPATYHYELVGVAAGDGHEEKVGGTIESHYTTHDSLPVGHVLVKGVDLFDGNLTVSRDDFSLPGRGVSLEFHRSYSSNNGNEPGTLGVGWDHNYNSRVIVTPCGDVIVMGGEGSGMRFVDDGHGALRPLRGYHGTLIATTANHSFEFYSKSGNHFHYGTFGNGAWHLSWIEDPNGNRTTLEYETAADAGSDKEPRVAAVRDAAGRTLRFHYQLAAFTFWKGQVLTSVEAPGGIVETFTYDIFGNLSRVAREPHPGAAAGASPSRAERYDYAVPPTHRVEDRHVLLAAHDELSGATTTDEIGFAAVGLQGDIQVKRTYVSKITDPEGGQTRFEFDPSLGNPSTATMTVMVTDPRDKVTTYTLNRYGSPLTQEDPEHHVTTSEWSPDDVLLTSRTDANGVKTTYTYDADGNVLTESVPAIAGGSNPLSVEMTYRPPAAFDPPYYIKDRIETRKDRNGVVTRFAYDSHGNLLTRKVTVRDVDGASTTLTVAHTFLANGDLATATDARGNTANFAYDAYGNLSQITDALRNVTQISYDVRSQAVRQVDALGRATLIDYDALGRVVRRTLPKADGESVPPAETMSHDDVARTVTATDVNGHIAVTTSDRDGRPVQVENGAGGIKVFQYDPAGNKILESTFGDAATPRQDTTFDYTDAGRLLRRTEPLGRVTEYEYDGVGNTLKDTLRDSGGGFAPRVSEHVYDGLNRRTQTTRTFEGGTAVTKTSYDGENKVQEEDPLGRITHYRYDELNRLIETTEPEWKQGKAKTTQALYDGNSNVVEERRLNEPASQIRRNEYDPLNRLRKKTDATGASWVFEYDAVGNKTQAVDPRLDATSFEYDARNRMLRSTVFLNRVTTPNRQLVTQYAYDAVGNRLQETLPNGNIVQRRYDALNRPIETTDRLGVLMAYTYDARGNRLRETDARGNDTVNHFDALDRLVQQDLPENRTVTMTWDAADNKLSTTDPRHNTTVFRYDRLNRLIETDDPAPGNTTLTATYDLAGNKKTETDRRGNVTSFDYDDLNRLVKAMDPASLGTSVSYTYDALANKLTETDRRGIVSENSYDAESRLIRVARAGVQLRTMAYDGAGNKTADTDANQHTTTYEYDERNLLTAENRPLAAVTHYQFDDMGDRSSMLDPEGRTSTYEHDLRQRPMTETNGAHEITRYEYDGNGNRTKQTRPSQKSWTFTYDRANRLISVTNSLSNSETYAYNGNGNRTAQTDANLHATTLEYDERNRLTAKVEPGGARWEFGYDGNGNQVRLQDPKGQILTFDHDPLNRETRRLYPAPAEPGTDFLQSIVTVHDGNGNPKTLTEQYSGPTGTRVTIKTYDDFDRLESVTDPKGEKLSYTYDANGNRKTLTDPDQKTTLYAYDDLNRLAAITVPATGPTEYTYFRDSRLKRVKYPSGGQADHTYDQAGRLQLLENSQNNAPVSRFAYTFDLNGNRIQQIETNGGAPETTTYAFDDADRLLKVTYPDKKVDYTYDGVGNRLTEVIKAVPGDGTLSSKTFHYDERNRLSSASDAANPSASTNFEFDANGNQTVRTQGGVRTEFHFDVRDKLIEVRRDGTLLEAYAYDYQGYRVRKAGAEGIFRYVFDDDSVLVQTDDAGNTIAKYDYGSDVLLSMTHVTEGRQFYLFDGLHSVTNLLKPDGSLAARYKYDAWGNYRATAGASFNIFGFTGHQRDSATSLYYFKARYYDPELGVFLSEDQAAGDANNPPSLHRYLYAYANPTVYVDLDGSAATDAEKLHVEGALRQNFEAAYQAATDPSNSVTERIVAGGLALLVAPATGIEDLGSAIVNIPYRVTKRSEVAAQKLADATITNDGLEKAKLRSEAIGEEAFAFVDLGTAVIPASSFAESPTIAALDRVAAKVTGKGAATVIREDAAGVGTNKSKLTPEAEAGAKPPPAKAPEAAPVKTKAEAKELNTGRYGELKKGDKVGDGLQHDHIPSFASLKSAEEARLGRSLTRQEETALQNKANAVTVRDSIHSESPTYKGRNTKEQIAKDAKDPAGAAKRDVDAMVKNATNKGVDPAAAKEAGDKLHKANINDGLYTEKDLKRPPS